MLIATAVHAATASEVEAWKKRFPTVSVTDAFGLRQMAAEYERAVAATTNETVMSTVRMLREKAEKDLAAATEVVRGQGAWAAEAKEKCNWIVGRLLPFLGSIS